MEINRKQTIVYVSAALLCINSLASAQLTYHLDANTNSYTLQTPNSQQSFTRHFNSQPGASNKATRAHPSQLAQAQSQPQQQYSTGPQQFAYSDDGQEQINSYYRQQQALQQQQLQQQQQQQQQQKQNEQNDLYTTYQVAQRQAAAAKQAQPIQSLSQQDLATYYQQVQQQEQQQQQQQQLQLQQQQLAAQQQFAYQQQGASSGNSGQYQQAPQYQQYSQAQSSKPYEQPSPVNNLLGVKFSPSNEVSHVKYTSDGLNYDF